MGRNDVVFKVIIDKKESEIKLKDLSKDFTDLGNSLKAVGRNATLIFAGLGAALTGLIIPAALFEKKMLDVSKTTGLVGDELKDLGSDLLTISKNSQLSAIALADIAFSAGQLGIQGRKNILAFTKSVGEISQALGFQAEFTATAMAVISKQFGIPIPEVQNLGSAINELSQTTSASAEQIIVAIQNVGPVLGRLRFSREQVAGLVSTFVTLTGSGERAAVALSRFFAQASDKFDELSKVVGLSQEQLQTLFDTDPTEFFLAVQEGFVGIESAAQRTAIAQRIFGIQGARAVLGNSEQLQLLIKNLKDSENAYRDNISITEELERVNTGFLAQLKIFRSELTAQAITLGDSLVPALKTLIGIARDGLEVFNRLPSPVKNLAVISLVLTTALAGLTAAFSFVAGNIFTLLGFFTRIIPTIINLSKVIRALTVAQTGLNLAFLANPIVLAITGIVVALGLLAFTFRDKFDEIRNTAKIFFEQMVAGFEFLKDAIKDIITLDISGLKQSFEEYRSATKESLDEIKNIWEETNDEIFEITDETLSKLPGSIRDIIAGINEETAKIKPPLISPVTGEPMAPFRPFVEEPEPVTFEQEVDLRTKEQIQKDKELRDERIRLAEETAAALLEIRQNQNFNELMLQDQAIQKARESELLSLELRRQVLQEQGLLDLEMITEFEAEEQAIKSRFDRIEIERQKQLSNLKRGILVNDLSTLKGFLGDVGVAFKEAAQALKIIRLGEAFINVANAITAALAGPFPANLANAAIVGAKGAAQIATINAQQFQEGAIEIPSQIPAILDPGEMVLTRSVAEGIRAGEISLGGPEREKGQETRPINMNFNFADAQFIGITDDIVDELEEKIIEKAETVGSALVSGGGF
jgi:TP901 family phage tail tape measure protein